MTPPIGASASAVARHEQTDDLLMQPTSEDTRGALLQLLSETPGPALGALDEELPAGQQIDLCIERTKAEATESAALVDACAPHGRALLTQAQQCLENFRR